MPVHKPYSRSLRVIHWLIAGVFLFIMLTIFLRQQWMNKDQMGDILNADLVKRNIFLTKDVTAKIGKSIRAPMWQWHQVAGYTLLGLYIIRMVILRWEGATFSNPFKKGLSRKERLKSGVYLLFYICFGTSLITGLLVVWGPREWHRLHRVVVDVHIQSMYYAVVFVIIHLAGLIIAELTNNKGIISRMIHGGP